MSRETRHTRAHTRTHTHAHAHTLGSATAVIAYMYFLYTRQRFEFDIVDNQLTTKSEAEEMEARGFDLRRYNELKKDEERFERYLDNARAL